MINKRDIMLQLFLAVLTGSILTLFIKLKKILYLNFFKANLQKLAKFILNIEIISSNFIDRIQELIYLLLLVEETWQVMSVQ